MYIIQDFQTGLLFHKKKQIILFEHKEEAQIFLNKFFEYSIQRFISETQDPAAIFTVQNRIAHCQIMEPNFDIESVKTVWFHEL